MYCRRSWGVSEATLKICSIWWASKGLLICLLTCRSDLLLQVTSRKVWGESIRATLAFLLRDNHTVDPPPLRQSGWNVVSFLLFLLASFRLCYSHTLASSLLLTFFYLSSACKMNHIQKYYLFLRWHSVPHRLGIRNLPWQRQLVLANGTRANAW